MMRALFILLSFFTFTAVGDPQMIQFASWVNITVGLNRAHLVILNSAPNISTIGNTYEEMVAKAIHVAHTGWWALFGGENFTGESWNTLYRDAAITIPEGTLSPYQKSIRHLGPPDTGTTSVSCYSGVGFGGSGELIEAEGDVPFEVESLFFTGTGTWNFYPDPDLGGIPVTYTNTRLPFRSCPSKADWPGVLQGKVIKSISRSS